MHSLDGQVSALIRQVAAEIVMPRFRNLADHHVQEKSPGDLVTIADHESEARLEAGLARIDPGARIIGEEASAKDASVLDRAGEGRVWLIDPIDGTHNFAHGHPPFGLMLALVQDGETEAAWIYDPVADRMCHAWRGHGAFIDGARTASRATGHQPPRAAIGFHYMPAEMRDAIRTRAARAYALVDIPRCAAEQYPRLILGINDIAVFHRTQPWDHAAGALLVNEAGGKVARPDGTPYRIGDDRKGLLAAASPALWEEAADTLYR